MSRIPQPFIDELLDRVDIVEVIDHRVKLKKTGKNYSACCPFHDEKTPSFT
ncbi:MAG TPA: CHC2 zinc finger domain-containing protein, partial [Cellvibrionaceae bacterium]